MIHIHPFPARMAPEIALERVQQLNSKHTVLDPMSGSGMVLAQASRVGVNSIGYDLDPLARLISRVGATEISHRNARTAVQQLVELATLCQRHVHKVKLPWIDECKETNEFIQYWFAPKQREQLRCLSYHLVENPFIKNQKILDLLKVSVSRLIVTKDPKASLARDTAHSRPHRTIIENSFDILEYLPKSVEHVLKALGEDSILRNAKSFLGDARRMSRIKDRSVDLIVTSPPYLNALDYMRGHRLSLVWLGYGVKELRTIRSKTIGAEIISKSNSYSKMLLKIIGPERIEQIGSRNTGMLTRYCEDLNLQLSEAARVLKPKKKAAYVIGNSNIKGVFIRNSEILKSIALNTGFEVFEEFTRPIPQNARYMPIPADSNLALGERMRAEHVIELRKI